MGAPKRLRLDVGGTSLSAFILPEMAVDDVPHAVCKECAPTNTKMKVAAEVTVLYRRHNQHWAIMVCGKCGREYAIPYAVNQNSDEVS
jgi:RNase P subunit RPR2